MSTQKKKRNKSNRQRFEKKIPDISVEDGEGYFGIVENIIGGNRINVKLNNGTTNNAIIPGRYRNRNWLKIGMKVLLNLDYEIVHIIRDNDVRAIEADKMLRDTNNDGSNIYFQNYGEEESENESIEESQDTVNMIGIKTISKEVEIKKTTFGNTDKTKSQLVRKEKDKERDISRKEGRVFSSVEDIEKEISNIITKNDNNDFNIDDI